MRTLIAVPCMDMVQTLFMTSLLSLRRQEDDQVMVCTHSLIYDARNILAQKAKIGGYDRILWLDSDMVFGPDLLEKLSADLDTGLDMVCAVYFTRKNPVKPCAYEALEVIDGQPTSKSVSEIPDGLFEIEGCGFGAVLMNTSIFGKLDELPFSPIYGWGEDLTFCLRAKEAGFRIWCDGRVKIGHAGISIIDESTWLGAKAR